MRRICIHAKPGRVAGIKIKRSRNVYMFFLDPCEGMSTVSWTNAEVRHRDR